MNDTPELDEALDQASETLTSEEEQEVEPQETPKEEQETEPKEEQLEEEETFADKPELEGKSPEELEEIYHSWNKAYTQKRQAEKQEMARMAERLQELEQKIPQEPEIPLNQMTPEQAQQFFSQKAEKIAQTARENSYIESQEKSFYELDGRLNDDSPEHDPNLFYAVVGQVSQLRDKHEQEKGTVFGFDFVGEAKRAIEAYDGHVKEQVQKFINNQNKTVKDKVNKFAKGNPKKAGAVKKAGGLEIDDAFKEALTEVGGSFEY